MAKKVSKKSGVKKETKVSQGRPTKAEIDQFFKLQKTLLEEVVAPVLTDAKIEKDHLMEDKTKDLLSAIKEYSEVLRLKYYDKKKK